MKVRVECRTLHTTCPGFGSHVSAPVSRRPLSNTNHLASFKCLLDHPYSSQAPPACGLSTCFLLCLERSSYYSLTSLLKRLLMEACLGHVTQSCLPFQHSLQIPSPYHFLLMTHHHMERYLFFLFISFILLIVLLSTRTFTPGRPRFPPSLSAVVSPVPTHCLGHRCSTDVLIN